MTYRLQIGRVIIQISHDGGQLGGTLELSPRLLCDEIGIARANRDQSPTRSRCSHWRKSSLKPMLSAIRNVEMTQRSICQTFRQFRRFADTTFKIEVSVYLHYTRKLRWFPVRRNGVRTYRRRTSSRR